MRIIHCYNVLSLFVFSAQDCCCGRSRCAGDFYSINLTQRSTQREALQEITLTLPALRKVLYKCQARARISPVL